MGKILCTLGGFNLYLLLNHIYSDHDKSSWDYVVNWVTLTEREYFIIILTLVYRVNECVKRQIIMHISGMDHPLSNTPQVIYDLYLYLCCFFDYFYKIMFKTLCQFFIINYTISLYIYITSIKGVITRRKTNI